MADGQNAADMVYGQDLQVGHAYQLGSHPVTEQEVIDFASQWDPQYFHVDPHAAQTSGYGGLIASGLHTLAIYQRLAVRDVFFNWSVIAGRMLREVRFLRPVRPGDTLSGTIVVEDVAIDQRNRALVTTRTTLVNQDDKPVGSITADAYIDAAPPTPI